MRNDDISARITSTDFVSVGDNNTLAYKRNDDLLTINMNARHAVISLSDNKHISMEVLVEDIINHLEKEKSPATRRHKSTWRKRPGREWSRGLYR